MTTPHKYNFTNPYLSVSGDYVPGTTARFTCEIPKEVHQLFARIMPERNSGVYQTTFAILTHKLVELLKQYGITGPFDTDDYKRIITSVQLIVPANAAASANTTATNTNRLLQRGATIGALRETLPSNDGGGKKKASRRNSGLKKQPLNVKEQVKQREPEVRGGVGGAGTGTTEDSSAKINESSDKKA